MNTMDFSFEKTPWELYMDTARPGSRLSAVRFLTLLESENDDALEEAFLELVDKNITLDISDLPADFGSGDTAVRLRREQQLSQTGAYLQELEENDPLRLYLEELAAIPACGDIEVFAMQLLENPTDSVRAALVNLSLSRVVELAGETTGHGVLLLDLVQEGSLGLWQAVMNYMGGDFQTHRDHYIRQYLAKAVVSQARESGVGRKMRQALEDYRAVDQRLLMELGRNPTLEEIADGMHVTLDEAVVAAEMLETARLLSRVKAEAEAPEQTPEDSQAVEDTAYFQTRQRINELLSGLSREDAKLLSLRFGLEGGLPMSPAEAGKLLGLTPEEVVAREAAALTSLRNG